MNLNKYLAVLESEMFCKGLHKSKDVLSALKEINSYTYEELCRLSVLKLTR